MLKEDLEKRRRYLEERVQWLSGPELTRAFYALGTTYLMIRKKKVEDGKMGL